MTAFESLLGNTAHDPSGEQQSPIDWRSGPPLPSLRPTTVSELIADCLQRFPDAPVVSDGHRTATWSDLNAWSAQVAAAWSAHLPVGGRCAILKTVAAIRAHLRRQPILLPKICVRVVRSIPTRKFLNLSC